MSDEEAILKFLKDLEREFDLEDYDDVKVQGRLIETEFSADLPVPGQVTITKADGTQHTRPMNEEELDAWFSSEGVEPPKEG